MLSKVKILVVDDEKEMTDMLVRFLTFEGFDVVGCNNPKEALELVKTDNFLICILDIQMPEMNGMDLLKEIKQMNGMTGVIMMTGFASTENILTCLRRGAETCLLKPLDDMTELTKGIQSLIKRYKGWQRLIQRLKVRANQIQKKAA